MLYVGGGEIQADEVCQWIIFVQTFNPHASGE